ncbi:lipase family protein [Vibrio hyugaensis]|uniref:lipase family protein n=1 Tax=Vibrio hyugaensis TaxID=1534743 RepID=UPI003DA167AB
MITGISGTSGGFFYRPSSGFLIAGLGVSEVYKRDIVFSFRGTKTLADGLTNATANAKGTQSGELVHNGFQGTLNSMIPEIKSFLKRSQSSEVLNIHCVGHSLGGALATLAANWLKSSSEISAKVHLYTFGAPRVGGKNFSINATQRVDSIFRCVNGADPVPKVPVWPFYHAPYNGIEYLASRQQGLIPSAHYIERYAKLTDFQSWEKIYSQKAANAFERVILNYNNRLEAKTNDFWADRISAAILTLLIDGGFASFVLGAQSLGAAVATIYDAIARSMVKISELSSEFAERVKGLLGHMLVFAGKVAQIAIKFTYSFIRWVFELVLGKLNQAVKAALKTTF